MSYLRISIKGEGLSDKIKLFKENERGERCVSMSEKDYMLYKASLDNDTLFFITGWSEECYKELENIRRNIAFGSPGITFNFFKHSTYTGLNNSFNFGCIDGEYREWEDCKSYAYHDTIIKCDGIGLIPEYGETDEWNCTHIWVNGKEFWLNELHHKEDVIMFNDAVNGTHNSDGFIEELVKATEEDVFVEENDMCTGECWGYEYRYQKDTGEVLRKEIEDYMWQK